MIKIVKSGTRKKVECLECGAVLSYEETDVIKESSELVKYPRKFIHCPQCNAEIILEATK